MSPQSSTPSHSEEVSAAKQAGLRHVSDASPGLTRLGSPGRFRYRDADGRPVRERSEHERLRALAIPPAWRDVWICPDPRGHLQATGRDARGRKQYRYHPAWQATRHEGKFDRIVEFGKALPRLRRRLRANLSLPGFPREKVLSIVVALLGETLIRVGNASYVRENGTYGLTTLRNRHVEFTRSGRARFQFRGKSGQQHDIVLDDSRLVRLVRHCQQLPGQLLFQYVDDDGTPVPVDSGEINAWLHEVMGDDFTAKDFRTWAATGMAFRQLAQTPLPTPARRGAIPERAFAFVEKAIVKDVADALGNTPAVCRRAYIDPSVFGAWREGRLAAAASSARGARQWEAATLRFLARERARTRKGRR